MEVVILGIFVVVLSIGSVYLIDTAVSAQRGRNAWRFAGGVVFVALTVVGLLFLATSGLNDRSEIIAGIALFAAGAVLGLLLIPRVRQRIATILPLDADAPRDWLGLVVLLWLVILRLATFYQGEDEVGQVQVAEAVIQTVVMFGIACALVGLFVRRNARQTLQRLGIKRLTPRQVAYSALVVFPFAVIAALTVLAVDFVQPGTLDRLEDTVTGMTGGDESLQFALMLGITAAIGEETLFRGALQPKYGLIFTSLVFALLHVQYDLLLIVASLFPAGLILGLERRYMGTTAAMITHALYNAMVVTNGY